MTKTALHIDEIKKECISVIDQIVRGDDEIWKE